MVGKIAAVAIAYPRAFGHWLMLDQLLHGPNPEIVCIEADGKPGEMNNLWEHHSSYWLPGLLYFHSSFQYPFPQLKNKKEKSGEIIWYSCVNQTCSLPLERAEEALNRIIASY